jgi:hypothetical protein
MNISARRLGRRPAHPFPGAPPAAARAAALGSCVTITMVLPRSRTRRPAGPAPPRRWRGPGRRWARRPRSARVGHQGPGDGHALLLAARQFVGVVVGAVGQAHQAQRGQRVIARSRRTGWSAAAAAPRSRRRQHRHQVVELEDEADIGGAPVGQPALAQRGDVDAGDLDAPPLGWSMPAIRFSSVLLPEPLGPISATNSPRHHVEVDVRPAREWAGRRAGRSCSVSSDASADVPCEVLILRRPRFRTWPGAHAHRQTCRQAGCPPACRLA